MNIRTKAIAAGQVRFSSGKPCRKGHMSERYTSNGACIACLDAKQAMYAAGTAKRRATYTDNLVTVHVMPQHVATVRACADILNSGDADYLVAFVAMMRTPR